MPNIFEEWTPDRILSLMLLMGLNRQQMATILDMANVSTFSRMLNGRTMPTAKRIVQLNTLNAAAVLLKEQARREQELAMAVSQP